jgi:hypothetical protein
MIFHDFTLAADGHIRSQRRHESGSLAVDAVAVFAGMLRTGGHCFRGAIPVPAFSDIELHWTQESDDAAVATFLEDDAPVTTSALLKGVSSGADSDALIALQDLIQQLGRGVLGHDVISIEERPAIVSVPFAMSPRLPIIADMETCLAAAYFDIVLRRPVI